MFIYDYCHYRQVPVCLLYKVGIIYLIVLLGTEWSSPVSQVASFVQSFVHIQIKS